MTLSDFTPVWIVTRKMTAKVVTCFRFPLILTLVYTRFVSKPTSVTSPTPSDENVGNITFIFTANDSIILYYSCRTWRRASEEFPRPGMASIG